MFGTKARTGQNERVKKKERKEEENEKEEKPLTEGKEEEERIKEENKREREKRREIAEREFSHCSFSRGHCSISRFIQKNGDRGTNQLCESMRHAGRLIWRFPE